MQFADRIYSLLFCSYSHHLNHRWAILPSFFSLNSPEEELAANFRVFRKETPTKQRKNLKLWESSFENNFLKPSALFSSENKNHHLLVVQETTYSNFFTAKFEICSLKNDFSFKSLSSLCHLVNREFAECHVAIMNRQQAAHSNKWGKNFGKKIVCQTVRSNSHENFALGWTFFNFHNEPACEIS